MSHLTDLAERVTTYDDRWALSEHRNREAGERARDDALALSTAAARIAARLRDELDAADIRTVYDNDPHRGQP